MCREAAGKHPEPSLLSQISSIWFGQFLISEAVTQISILRKGDSISKFIVMFQILRQTMHEIVYIGSLTRFAIWLDQISEFGMTRISFR